MTKPAVIHKRQRRNRVLGQDPERAVCSRPINSYELGTIDRDQVTCEACEEMLRDAFRARQILRRRGR